MYSKVPRPDNENINTEKIMKYAEDMYEDLNFRISVLTKKIERLRAIVSEMKGGSEE